MRYATIPAKEIAPLLGWNAAHLDGEWVKPAEFDGPPVDARGIAISDCVFADTETGLTVIRDSSGRLRPHEFKAPLTVKVK